METYINGKRITLSPKKAIGKGGEADIFDIGNNQALKLFKTGTHPDYQGLSIEQKLADQRLKTHQQKLPQFPKGLPLQVITPQQLTTDKTGKTILGYTMQYLKKALPLFKYSLKDFALQNGITKPTITTIFQNLYQLITEVHQHNITIGDFNDLNVLIDQETPYLIDTDSFQFGNFYCTVFTQKFVDPLLCNQQATQPELLLPYNPNSDWYAYNIMLMQSLLHVDPYGGVYKPKSPSKNIPHSARPLQRITVFNPDVKYPKPAIPYHTLSDDLLQHFYACFQEDQRHPFPIKLLNNLQWRKCTTCGVMHLRNSCPLCTATQVTVQPPLITLKTITGKVTMTPLFTTEGVILSAISYQNQLYYLYHEQGQFKRESGQIITEGNLNPNLSLFIQRNKTLIAKQGQVIILDEQNKITQKLAVDSFGNKPMIAVNQEDYFWLYNGQLLKQGLLGSEYGGDVLQSQTQFWLGNRFGFGFYRAGYLQIAFVFDAKKPKINDQVKLPSIRGELIESNCIFSDNYCYFFTKTQDRGKESIHLYIIQWNGVIILETDNNEQDWLKKINGYCAIGKSLFTTTDEGIIRLEIQQNKLVKICQFPDTESFVTENDQLLISNQGLYVISEQKISLLQMQP